MSIHEPLMLPSLPEPARRPPLPLLGSIVPVVAAVVMWLVTGSLMMLAFAALGPLIAVASLVDGARASRRDRRRDLLVVAAARREIAHEIKRSHDAERDAKAAAHPRTARLLQRQEEIWRAAPARGEALVVGTGEIRSALRVIGGDHDPESHALRADAATVAFASVTVPLGAGVCVVGPAGPAAAVARALVIQACLVHPPHALALVAAPPFESGWAEALPHWSKAPGVARRIALVDQAHPTTFVQGSVDITIGAAAPGAPIPAACGAILTLTAIDTAQLEWGAEVCEVSVEPLSGAQAGEIALTLALRAADAFPAAVPPAAVALAELLEAPPVSTGGLAAVIGVDGAVPVVVDLVADGPHAVVTGITGSGKSELLLTWITALCAQRSPAEVTFLLADFKGGMAFDALAGLPHVTGIITDLDGAGAQRAIQSLRAELRRREAQLAMLGARDIADPRVELPRLVIVVDEFAALLGEQPELHAVFTDIGARGRALGMHLVLGTQRASGVLRDALFANCPLRISLRVVDSADSRAVIGTDAAALLPGDVAFRGMAFVLRAGDTSPQAVRVARAGSGDIERAMHGWAQHPSPRRPWLPPLPTRLTLAELSVHASEAGEEGSVLLGLVDHPERQRQVALTLDIGGDRGLSIIGAAGSGKSAALALIAAQVAPELVWRLPTDPEEIWDALSAREGGCTRGSVVLIDDLDAMGSTFPPEYAHEAAAMLESFVRRSTAAGATVVLTAQRLSGPAARIADLVPRRLLLAMPSRADHIAVGGDPTSFVADAPPGRGSLGLRTLQLALAPEGAALSESAPRHSVAPAWHPIDGVSAVIARDPRAVAEAWERSGTVQVVRVDELEPGAHRGSLPPSRRLVILGHAEAWQRRWSLLTELRADHDVVVDASCPAEFRALTGTRGLAPFAEPGRRRAWLCRSDGTVSRVSIPEPS